MKSLKKMLIYGSMILVSSFGLTLSATASDFSNALLGAHQGDSHSQILVAKAYMYGEGVTQSDEKAFEWILKSAKQGNNNGEFILASLYDIGQGVQQNYETAYFWYYKALTHGDIDAFSAINRMHDEGRISQQEYEKARKFRYPDELSFDFSLPLD